MTIKDARGKEYSVLFFVELARGLILYLLFLGVGSMLSFFFVSGSSHIVKDIDSAARPMVALSTLTLVFAFYSLARAFELYDLTARRAFLDGYGERYTLLSDIAHTFKHPVLLLKLHCQLAVVLALALFLPYSLGYGYMIRAIFWEGGSSTVFNVVKILIVCPSVTLLLLLAKTSAHKWWVIARTSERERLDRLKKPILRLFLEVLKIVIIYSLSFSVLPMVIMLLLSFLLMAELFKTQPWILAVIIVFFFILASVRTVLCLVSRRRFYNRLRRTLSEEGYTLADEYRPIISSVLMRSGANFRISKGEKSYTCKLVATGNRRLPVYINPEGFYTVKRTVGFLKLTLFHIMKDVDYTFDSNDKRIVVFTPMPKRVFINYGRTDTAPDDGDGGGLPISVATRASILGGGKAGARSIHGPGYISDVDRGVIKPFETGERIGGYKFFTPEGFISAIDNDCLDR